jgi:hypothetical protein
MDGVSFFDERRYAQAVLNTLLGGSMFSRLWQEVREKRGLAYEIGSYAMPMSDGGLFVIYGGVAPSAFEQAVQVIEAELETLLTTPPDEAEVESARNLLKAAGVCGRHGASLSHYRHTHEIINREFYQTLLNTALAAATTVDPELHKTFRPGEETTEKYQRAIEPLAKIQATNPQIKFIYTFIRKDGKIYFVLDATPPGDHDHDGVEDKSYIGDEYPEATHCMHQVIDTGAPQVGDWGTDRWGSFVSAYVPLRDRTGAVIGALGVDIAAQDYLQSLEKARSMLRQNAVFAFVIAAVVGGWTWVFLRYRARVEAAQHAQRAQMQFTNHIREQILAHAPLLVSPAMRTATCS